MITLGLILTIFCPCVAHSKEISIEEMNSTMEAWLGKNLTIPCVLAKDANQELDLDVSTVGIRWSKILPNGTEMYIYTFTGHSHKQIRSGSFIDKREMRRGNATLTLHHVQRGDEGEYTCTIIVTPNKALAKRNVTVLAKPYITLSTTKLTIEPGRKDSVFCELSMFYPEAVKIQWGKYNKSSGTWSLLDKPPYRSEIQENIDGSFNVSSQLVVEPSSPEENGDVYYCVVTHGSSRHDQNVSFTLTVKELPSNLFLELQVNILFGFTILVILVIFLARPAPPKVSEIVGVDDLVHMKRSTLAFMVSGFKPKNIEIHLYWKRADRMEKIKSWKYPPPQLVIQYKKDHQGGERLTPAYNKVGCSLESEILPLIPKTSFILNSSLCSTYIIPDKERDEGAELVIEVIHAAKKLTFVSQQIKISEVEPFGEPIPLKHGQHQDGQKMERQMFYHPSPTLDHKCRRVKNDL